MSQPTTPKKTTAADIAASLARAALDDPTKSPCKRVRLRELDSDVAHKLGVTPESRTLSPGDGHIREIRVLGTQVLFALDSGACIVVHGWGHAEL